MPTTRNKRTRGRKKLTPAEYVFLTGDDSGIELTGRDAARVKVMRRNPDAWLMFGDRTANELLEEYPEYAEHSD